MSKVTGVVIKRRESVSKAGNDTYSLLVRDGDGNEEWYGFGVNDPKVYEGTAISFEAERNGRWLNGEAKTVKVEKEVPTEAQSAGRNDVNNAIRSANAKERSIMTQTAYKVAVDAVNGMAENGVVKFSKTNTEAGRESAVELYMGLLHDTAQQVFNKFADPLELTTESDDEGEESDPYNS